MYGYLSVFPIRDRLAETDARMREFARSERFDLAMIFHETERGGAAFAALLVELRRADCLDVPAPSLSHLEYARSKPLEAEARRHAETGAKLWALDRNYRRI